MIFLCILSSMGGMIAFSGFIIGLLVTHDLVEKPDQKISFMTNAVLWCCTLALFLGCGMCAAEDRICEAVEKLEKS